jgi:hypothetical protein
MAHSMKHSLLAVIITFLFSVSGWPLSLKQGPMIGNLTETSVTIAWKTDQPCNGAVEVVTEKGRPVGEFKALSKDNCCRYEAIISGLKAGTQYGYSVKGQNETGAFESRQAWFSTDVPGSKPFRFVSMADSRGSYNGVNVPILSKIVSRVKDAKPSFLFF